MAQLPRWKTDCYADFPFAVAICILLSLATISCGLKAGISVPNDPIPSGTIVAQGNLQGVGGQTVSGATTIYLAPSGSYTLHIDGLTAPKETGLQVIAAAQSGDTATNTLALFSGTQNFSLTGVTGTVVWKQVRVFSPTKQMDYGVATLQ